MRGCMTLTPVLPDAYFSMVQVFFPSDLPLVGWFIVVILFVIFTVACVQTFRGRRLAHQRVSEVRGLFGGLPEGTILTDMRPYLREQASSTSTTVKHIWYEFDETLVPSRRGDKLENTLEAQDVFSSQALAPEIFKNRLMGFWPSALTAVGVLGTFIGLAIGLDGLQLTENVSDEQAAALQSGIQQLIGGVSAAFSTSIWGVLLSLVFSIVRNGVMSKVIREIHALQQFIDERFDKHTSETSLINIEYHSYESAKALSELHEKIGTKLQEAVSTMSNDMQTAVTRALESAIAPVMKDIAGNSKDQTTEALSSLLGEFQTSFRQYGSQQAEELSNASAGMSDSAAAMSSSMTEALQSMGTRSEQLQLDLGRLLDAINEERKHSAKLVTDMASSAETSSHAMRDSSKLLESSGGRMERAAEAWQDASDRFTQQRDAVVSDLERMAAEQRGAAATLEKLTESNRSASEALEGASAQATEGFSAMKAHQTEFLENLQTNVELLQEKMREWLNDYSAAVSTHTTERMNEWNEHSRDYAGKMRDIAAGLSISLEEIDDLKGRMTDASSPASNN